jgi:diguanylate cyclase (GGDEF)-like protein
VRQPRHRSRPWRWRWARFRRDRLLTRSLGRWGPVLGAATLVGSLILAASALQSERERNELIRRTASAQLDQIAVNHELETRDWATWDETYHHVIGASPDYYGNDNYTQNTLQRIPWVMVLDRRGELVSSAHWSTLHQRIEPLPAAQAAELLGLIPERRRLVARSFVAMVQGRPHLISLQPILPSSGSTAPAGRLLFARSLDGPENAMPRQALALQRYRMEPVRPLPNALLGPLAIAVRTPRLDGLQPLQITAERAASERHNALRGLLLLLALDGGVLALLLLLNLRGRRGRLQSLVQRREGQRLRRALEQRASIDPLTGLLNGHGLLAALERQGLQGPCGWRALLQIDIRHFALINNSFGRPFGDRVLSAVARWLEQALGPSSLIARTAGDEFSCCLLGGSSGELRSRIQALSGRLEQLDLEVDGRSLRLTASAGARLLADSSAETALQEAGLARNLAKHAGQLGCQFYDDQAPTLDQLVAMQRLNQDLITSLKDDRIALFAQPAWRLTETDLPVVDVELLARVHDPGAEEGLRYSWSEALVEAATHCGTMPLLDGHVLALSCRSLRQLLRQHPRDATIGAIVFAINLSAETLLADDFVPRVQALLEQEGLDPRQLCFEITEQAVVRHLAVVKRVMERLRRLGIRFSLDDFGAGMTSLSHLHDLPLDYVKIDKAFIGRIEDDAASRITVEFVVRLGRELGFEVIAEGVEQAALLEQLRTLGVNIVQGYLTAMPVLFDPLRTDPGFGSSGRDRLAALSSLPA